MNTQITPPLDVLHAQQSWFFLRYVLVGIIGALIQTLTLFIWVSILMLQEHYLWGVVLGFSLALAVTFTMQKYWTFKDGAHERAPRQLLIYTAIALLSLVLNAVLLAGAKALLEMAGLDFFHGWYVAAQILIIGFVAALSFVLNRIFTFTAV